MRRLSSAADVIPKDARACSSIVGSASAPCRAESARAASVRASVDARVASDASRAARFTTALTMTPTPTKRPTVSTLWGSPIARLW